MFSSKIKTIRDCLVIREWGKDFRSRQILSMIDLLNHLGRYRSKLRQKINDKLARLADGTDLKINVRISKHVSFPVKVRLHDTCDYQGVTECLGNMYDTDVSNIRYVIDAGGNMGFFAISMLKRSSVAEGIIIEPNPDNIKYIQYNLQTVEKFSLIPVAVGKDDGECVFNLEGGSNSGHLQSGEKPAADRSVVVESRKLSALVPAGWDTAYTLLKIDVEGSEYDVLPEIFSQKYFPGIIVGEIHDYLRRDGIRLIELLQRNGYKVSVTGHGTEGNVCRQFTALRNISK